jgi:hypothetical protein
VGPVWTDKDTGYFFFIDSSFDVKYRKTTDGGANWAAAVDVGGAISASHLDVWFDKWTPGDSGTVIHIWWLDFNIDDVLYRSLDTSGDSLGTLRTVFAGASFGAGIRNTKMASGVKAVGGNLYVQFWGDNVGERGFYRSVDAGANWTSRTDGADDDTVDEVLCLPDDDSADNQDIVMVYWDRSASELSIKKYDDSANTWGETSISGSMTSSSDILQMNAVVRHSDGHIIVAAWSELDSVTADLRVWDITLATPTITAKADVVTNSDDCVCCALFIDQNNDDLYCGYLGNEDGSETWQATLTAFYKKSGDGGGTWGAQAAYQEGAADDERSINAGHSTSGTESRFAPVFFNDDDNVLFVNKVNSVEITAAGGQTISPSGIASAEAFGAAQLNLAFTATGIASAEAFGSASVAALITGAGIASAEAFGSAQLNLAFTASGIASAEAFGAATVTLGGATQSLTPNGIVSAEAFGSAQLNLAFTASGIVSLEAFGSATVTTGVIFSDFGTWRALINPNDYPTNAQFFFEAIIATSDAGKAVSARLFNITDASVVTDSEVTSTDTSGERVLSSALSLPSADKEYRAERGGEVGATYRCYAARVRVKSG